MKKIPDEGGLHALGVLYGTIPKPDTLTLQLFTDNIALDDADNHTTHTVASGGGYTDKVIANNATIAINNGLPEAVWSEETWIFTGLLAGEASIYGYQVLAGTTILWEETLPKPFHPENNGDELIITIKQRFGNGVPI